VNDWLIEPQDYGQQKTKQSGESQHRKKSGRDSHRDGQRNFVRAAALFELNQNRLDHPALPECASGSGWFDLGRLMGAKIHATFFAVSAWVPGLVAGPGKPQLSD